MKQKLLLAIIEKGRETGKPVRWLDWFDYGKKVVLKGRDILCMANSKFSHRIDQLNLVALLYLDYESSR